MDVTKCWNRMKNGLVNGLAQFHCKNLYHCGLVLQIQPFASLFSFLYRFLVMSSPRSAPSSLQVICSWVAVKYTRNFATERNYTRGRHEVLTYYGLPLARHPSGLECGSPEHMNRLVDHIWDSYLLGYYHQYHIKTTKDQTLVRNCYFLCWRTSLQFLND